MRPVSDAQAATETELWGSLLLIVIVGVCAGSFVFSFVVAIRILTAMGFGVAILGYFRPAIGLLGVGMLCTLDAFSRVYVLNDGRLPWNTFGYWLLLFMILLLPDIRRLAGPQVGLALAFLFLLTLELSFSTSVATGVQHVFSMFALFGLLLYCDRAAKYPESWMWLGLVSGVLAASVGFAYLSEGDSVDSINRNAWAYLPLTALCLAAVSICMVRERALWRRSLIALSIVNLGWVFLSASRGTFLMALIVAAFVIGAGFSFETRRPGLPGGVRAALVLAAGLALFTFATHDPKGDQGMVARIAKLFDEDRSLANRTSGRSELMRIGWSIFREHPLGIGTGSFADAAAVYGFREDLSVFRDHPVLQAHSGWIKTLAENGVPGVVLFVAFLLSFAVIGFRRRAAGVFPLGLLTTVVLSVAFLSTEFQAKGLWLFAAAVIVVLRKGRFKEAQRERRRPLDRGPLAWIEEARPRAYASR